MKNNEFVKMLVLLNLAYIKSNEEMFESKNIRLFTIADIWRFLKLSLNTGYPTIMELWELIENLQHSGLVNIDEDSTLSKSHLSITLPGLSRLINFLRETDGNSEVKSIKERLYDLWTRETKLSPQYSPFNCVTTNSIIQKLEKYLNKIEKSGELEKWK